MITIYIEGYKGKFKKEDSKYSDESPKETKKKKDILTKDHRWAHAFNFLPLWDPININMNVKVVTLNKEENRKGSFSKGRISVPFWETKSIEDNSLTKQSRWQNRHPDFLETSWPHTTEGHDLGTAGKMDDKSQKLEGNSKSVYRMVNEEFPSCLSSNEPN